MAKAVIRLCYRKIIDVTSSGRWDKLVFEATHKEFFMQAQQFDQQKKYTTFNEIIANVPKSEALHYLVSTAIAGYLRELEGIIPDVRNQFDKPFLTFRNFKFEILTSHTRDKNQHKIAIYFYSDPVTWLETFGKTLIVTTGDETVALQKGMALHTEMIEASAQLSICSYQEIPHAAQFSFIERPGNEILN